MEERRKKQRQIGTGVVLLVMSLAFYLVWYALDGIILTEDAPSYINMYSDREPGYCLYLMLFRILFGSERYLHAAVIGQCAVAAVAACAITMKLTELFSLSRFGSGGILAVQYGITLLNRFVAQRRYSYFNSIETEGLTYSFWVFWFLCILGIWYKRDGKSVAGAVFWSIILISIRKHMMITLVLLLIVLLYIYVKEKRWKRAAVYTLLVCVLCFAGTKLVDCSYNLMVRGKFAPHTGDSSFILGTELYLADEKMAENIKDMRNRDIFLEIMRRADKKGYNIAYADKGWQAIEEHYSGAYDRIKFDIVMAVIGERQETEGIVGADRDEDYNLIVGTVMKELLIPTLPRLVRLFLCNVIHGFITTILKVHHLLNWGALLLYFLYAATVVWVWNLRRGYADMFSGNPVYFALLVLLAIFVNVCFTSLTIYCQMRYMLYNTGLFYQAWWIMLLDVKKCIRRKGTVS